MPPTTCLFPHLIMAFREPPNTVMNISPAIGTPNVSSSFPVMVRHNWASPFEVISNLLTSTTASKYSGAEDRVSFSSRPARACKMQADSLNVSQTVRQRMLQQRTAQDIDTLYPLACDALPILSVVGNLVTVADSSLRRFFRGGVVMLAPDDGSYVEFADEHVPVFTATIASMTSTTMTLDLAPPIAIPTKGWSIFPALAGQGSLKLKSELLTSQVGSFQFAYEETAADTALPFFSFLEDVTAEGYTYLNGDPVLEPDHNFKDSAVARSARQGQSFRLPRRRYMAFDGPRPRVLYDTDATLFSREDWYKLIRLWESRRGSLRPLWFVSPEVWWEGPNITTTAGSNLVRLPKRGYETDVEALLRGMKVVTVSGVVLYREVTLVNKIPTTDDLVITVDSNWPTTEAIDYVQPIYKCRLSSDTFREKWLTAEVCEVSLSVSELIDEADHELTT